MRNREVLRPPKRLHNNKCVQDCFRTARNLAGLIYPGPCTSLCLVTPQRVTHDVLKRRLVLLPWGLEVTGEDPPDVIFVGMLGLRLGVHVQGSAYASVLPYLFYTSAHAACASARRRRRRRAECIVPPAEFSGHVSLFLFSLVPSTCHA